MSEKSRYAGRTYKTLEENDRRKLDASVLRAVNIRQLSPTKDQSSVYHIFERLNTGGTPLSAQEIRNTVYRGKIVKALHVANEDPNWRLHKKSVKSSYGNLILWRHDFVHEGKLPQYADYDEARQAYELGKGVIHCFCEALNR